MTFRQRQLEAKKAAKVLDYAGNATAVLGLENLSRLLLQSAKLEVSTEGGDGDIPKSATCEKSFHRSVEALSLTARTLRLIERRFCPCEHGNACDCLCAELQDDRWRKPSGQDVALKIDPKNFLRHAYFNSTHQVCASSREAGKVLHEIVPEVHVTLPNFFILIDIYFPCKLWCRLSSKS